LKLPPERELLCSHREHFSIVSSGNSGRPRPKLVEDVIDGSHVRRGGVAGRIEQFGAVVSAVAEVNIVAVEVVRDVFEPGSD